MNLPAELMAVLRDPDNICVHEQQFATCSVCMDQVRRHVTAAHLRRNPRPPKVSRREFDKYGALSVAEYAEWRKKHLRDRRNNERSPDHGRTLGERDRRIKPLNPRRRKKN